MSTEFSYPKSVKSSVSDELVNTYLLRPVAGLIVRALYPTRITPNHVTVASVVAGMVAAALYLPGEAVWTAAAGIGVTLKDVLDSADGQLARAKGQYSRVGRFLDSIGDFVVDIALFGAIGWSLVRTSGEWWWLLLAFGGLVGITLRVSYHVYYQTSYLHLGKTYEKNRIVETITEEDLRRGGLELVSQRVFQAIYGWQDRLMVRIDRWCRSGSAQEVPTEPWYSDTAALRLSGLLGFGTELFLLMVCSVANRTDLYLLLNLVLMNGVWITAVVYRKWVLGPRLR